MMTRSEQRALNRGVLESEALNSSGADCYAAASASFDIGLGDARRDRPFLDRARAEGGQARPRWPQGAPYAVCLSHDVDSVSELDLRSHLRRFKKRGLYSLASPFDSRAMRALRSSVWSAGRSVANWRRVDPLHCYERWLELEAEVGTQSTFFFLPESYLRSHYSDGGYRYDDVIRFDGQRCSVAEMMREIHRRGWEVGLHASWHTFSSVDAMKREKAQVEAAIDAAVLSVRQHNLHFDVRITPRVCRDAGLHYDSSLGFNDDIGFRMGTCLPWNLHDCGVGSDVAVLELPLVIQGQVPDPISRRRGYEPCDFVWAGDCFRGQGGWWSFDDPMAPESDQ